MNRREFTQQSLQTTVGFGLGLTILNNRNSTVFGQSANEKINLGIIGCGGRGRQLLGDFVKRNDINILYCCDAQGNRAEQALKIVADSPLQQTPKPYEVPDNI